MVWYRNSQNSIIDLIEKENEQKANEKKENVVWESQDQSEKENPNTGSFIPIALILVLVFSGIMISIYQKSSKKIYKL